MNVNELLDTIEDMFDLAAALSRCAMRTFCSSEKQSRSSSVRYVSLSKVVTVGSLQNGA